MKKETSLSHIAMCINESETPFFKFQNLCYYVFKNKKKSPTFS